MKNKKGFALIETMITIVVLATALISLYVLFNNMLIKEKRRMYYDDPIFVVRSDYILNMFLDALNAVNHASGYVDNHVDLGDLLNEGNVETSAVKKLYLRSFSCDNTLFKDNTAVSYAQCQNIYNDFELYRVYISRFDLSYIDTCENSNSDLCINYNMLNTQAKNYLRSLPYVPGGEGYYVIFEYYDNGSGEKCTNENCMHQFASFKYGGTNEMLNFN